MAKKKKPNRFSSDDPRMFRLVKKGKGKPSKNKQALPNLPLRPADKMYKDAEEYEATAAVKGVRNAPKPTKE